MAYCFPSSEALPAQVPQAEPAREQPQGEPVPLQLAQVQARILRSKELPPEPVLPVGARLLQPAQALEPERSLSSRAVASWLSIQLWTRLLH
jgi:hypothetical protein